jgi:hypothetical protein
MNVGFTRNTHQFDVFDFNKKKINRSHPYFPLLMYVLVERSIGCNQSLMLKLFEGLNGISREVILLKN